MRNFSEKSHSHKVLRINTPFKRQAIIWGLLLMLLSCAATTRAQEDETNPMRGIYPGVSYDVSSFGAVNQTTGNVTINIPLVSLPAGRGGMNMGVSLTYNSKLWDAYTNVITEDVGEAPRIIGRERILEPSKGGGWRLTGGYEVNDVQISTEPCLVNGFINRLEVIFPDGSAHEFLPYGYQSKKGLSQIQPDGWSWDHSNITNCDSVGARLVTTAPMSYFSTDGTYMRLEFAHDSDMNGANNPWTLYLPDGGRVTTSMTSIGSPDVQRIYDRNNNYVEILFANAVPGRTDLTITDQEGRSITIAPLLPSPANGSIYYVTAKGFGGEELRWTIHWKNIHVVKSYDACSGSGCPPGAAYDLNEVLSMVDQITLPVQSGGLSYTFDYNARDYVAGNYTYTYGWGEISSVTLPSGAQATYQYTYDGVDGILSSYAQHRNYPTQKTVTYDREYDGTSTPVTDTWVYAITTTDGTVTGPDGGATHDYHYGFNDTVQYRRGLVYKSEQSNGAVVENFWRPNTPAGTSTFGGITPIDMNAVLKTQFTSIPDASGALAKTAIKDYFYDKNGNVTQVKEYDWVAYSSVPRDANGYPTGVPAGAPLKRVTTNSYYSDTPDSANITTDDADSYYRPTAPLLRNAIKSSEIGDGSQTLSRTEFFYSNATTTGNITKQMSWDSQKAAYSNPLTTTNSISVTHQYDAYGNRTLTTDGRGYQEKLVYGAIGGFTGLYPTESYSAFGTTVQRKSTQVYDFDTGLVTSVTDVDNNITSTTDYDVYGRPTLVREAVGKPEETQTVTEYDDTARRMIVRRDLNSAGDGQLVSIRHYDQLGRPRLLRHLENPATESETDETDGIKVQKRYAFSGSNSYKLASNPYRAATSGAATAETTMGWVRSKSDNSGRVVEVRSYSGSGLPAPWGANATTTGAVTTVFNGNATRTVTDQAGKDRQVTTDALDNITQVIEDPGTGGLNYVTTYTYDAFDNLKTVTQSGLQNNTQVTQTRTFTYDSFARLQSAVNPEGATINYEYDSNGNLTQKSQARSTTNTITINISYDALNRPTLKDYDNTAHTETTPDVRYYYDAQTLPTGAPTFVRGSSEGRLVAVTTGGTNAGTYYGYDALGRPLRRIQRTDSVNYLSEATYNRAGGILTETYPAVPGATDRRTISYTFDVAGRLSSLITAETTYAIDGEASLSSVTYSPNGELTSETLGNGLIHGLTYNNRLQISQIKLGTTAAPTSLLNLTYTYGTTTNNGNVLNVLHKIGAWTSKQIYTYDGVNRLDNTSETNGSTTTFWTEDNAYDRFGNRWEVVSGTPAPTFNAKNQTNGFVYDLAGNITSDMPGRTYVYDAENRLATVNGVANTYVYDGEGKRIKKFFAAGEQVRFVYGIRGRMVAEFSSATSALKKEYIYGANGLLATIEPAAGTKYATTDHLGSPRVITNSAGGVVSRRDYKPFGKTLSAGDSLRTSAQFFGASDDLRQKFTTYEHDEEVGLEYAQSRYYSISQGRFMSVDPNNADAELEVPQSWNGYTYARNNPVRYADPGGETITICNLFTDQPFSQRCTEHRDSEFKSLRAYCERTGECEIVDDGRHHGRIFQNGVLIGTFYNDLYGTPGGELVDEMNNPDNWDRAAVSAIIRVATGPIYKVIQRLLGKKPPPSTTPGLPKSAPKPLGRGSTGRTTPKNLKEQMAMEEAMANPGLGERAMQKGKVMNDPRWPAAEGWEKKRQNINGVEIHYNYNKFTHEVDDFKFKDN